MSAKIAWWGHVSGIRGRMGVHPLFRGQKAAHRALECPNGRYSFGTLCPCIAEKKTHPRQNAG